MFTVYFHPSTTTPPQPGLGQLVEAALVDCGGQRTGMEAEVRLPDGGLLYLFGEDDDGLMLAEYPELTPSVADALLAILRRTNGFLLDAPDTPTFLRAVGAVGEPQGAPTFDIEVLEVEASEALADLLRELPNNKAAARPTRSSRAREANNRSSLLDFLFGKPG